MRRVIAIQWVDWENIISTLQSRLQQVALLGMVSHLDPVVGDSRNVSVSCLSPWSQP